MKKIWKYAILLVALSALLCMSAFAADGLEVNNFVEDAVAAVDGKEYFTATYTGQKDAQYLIIMLAGTETGSMPDPTKTKILYVNQAQAGEDGVVNFETVYPMALEDSVIWLTGGPAPVALASIDVPEPVGVTVSGTVTSFGKTTNAVTITLSNNVSTYTTTAAGGSENAAWSFTEAIPSGTYTLTISKIGHGSYTEEITVGTDKVEKAVSIYLLGDINMDGKYTSVDTLMCKRIVAETLVPNTRQAVLADVNKDGKHTSVDTLMMKRLVAETYSVE